MTSSAQLEQEAEQTRAELSQTLDELRERLTPGQLVDQALDYAKGSGGAAFVQNLGRQTVSNPLPIALIGTGLAWLMLSDRNHASALRNVGTARNAAESVRRSSAEATERATDWTRDAGLGMADAARDVMEGMRSAAAEAANDLKSNLGETTSSIVGSAASLYETAKSRASGAYEQAAGAADRAASKVSESADDLREKAAGASKSLQQICREQPLVLAGLGLAIGAIMGALIPSTETEDRLMGDTSDKMKDKARDIAEGQIDEVKTAVRGETAQATEAGQLQSRAETPHSEALLVPATD